MKLLSVLVSLGIVAAGAFMLLHRSKPQAQHQDASACADMAASSRPGEDPQMVKLRQAECGYRSVSPTAAAVLRQQEINQDEAAARAKRMEEAEGQ